jgi:hypothetical protein
LHSEVDLFNDFGVVVAVDGHAHKVPDLAGDTSKTFVVFLKLGELKRKRLVFGHDAGWFEFLCHCHEIG